MAEVKPFKGITYNDKKISDFSKVLAPPYDTINKKEQSELYMKSSFNIIRLILGIDLPHDNPHENKYTRAKQYLDQWMDSKILIKDQTHCFYICAQDYKINNEIKTRWGFVGLFKMDPRKENIIFPHENTYEGLKRDRLDLLTNVEANLSPIFTLYSDTGDITEYIKSMCERWKPYIDTEVKNVRNRMWKLKDKVSLDNIKSSMEDKQLFVADGHHRLEVAREYQRMCMEEYGNIINAPFNYTMMYFTSLEDESLTILPTHRIIKYTNSWDNCIKKIKDFFEVIKYKSKEKLKNSMLKAEEEDAKMLGVYEGKSQKFYGLKLKNQALEKITLGEDSISDYTDELDVLLLHNIIIEECMEISNESKKMDYTSSFDKAIQRVNSENYDVAFLLNPLKIEQLQKIVKNGNRLPRKSTYFYPKITSGLSIYKF